MIKKLVIVLIANIVLSFAVYFLWLYILTLSTIENNTITWTVLVALIILHVVVNLWLLKKYAIQKALPLIVSLIEIAVLYAYIFTHDL